MTKARIRGNLIGYDEPDGLRNRPGDSHSYLPTFRTGVQTVCR